MFRFSNLGKKLTLAALISMSMLAPVNAKEVYSFGVVPQFEARKLSEIWVPILDQLEQRTGVEFQMVGSPRIPEFEQAFTNGDFDFAYMNPYHALMAFSAQGYTPLVNDGGRELFGILVVQKDSPIQSASELGGKKLAFPAPNALGASLLMRADLDTIFKVKFSTSYVSTHSSAYLNVALGEADAAGGVMGTFRAQPAEIRDKLRIIYETRKVPPHPVVVHPRVPKEVQEKVRQAFLDMAATDEGAELLSKIPIRAATSVNEESFYSLREMNLENYLVKSSE